MQFQGINCQMRMKMMALQAVGLAWLICAFLAVSDLPLGANSAPAKDCRVYDGVNQSVCPENQLDQDSGRLTSPAYETKCGGQVYNKTQQLCCGPPENKKLLNKTSNMEGCCGHRVYNCETHICNQTSLEVRARSVKLDCCGMDPCLTAGRLTSPAYETKCGGQVYNKTQQLCCGPPENKKLLNKTSNMEGCCGHRVYNCETHICNQTSLEVRARSVKLDCCGMDPCLTAGRLTSPAYETKCGGQVYNKTQQLCCGPPENKKLLNKTSNMEGCCGHRVYNCETHICNQTSLEVRARSVKLDCCGMDPCLTAGRLTSPAYETKCGGQVYNKTQQLCCGPPENKKLLNKTSNMERCCGHRVYNCETHICNQISLEVRARSVKLDCCGMDRCLTAGRLTSPAYETKCGGQVYNKTQQLCCGPPENKKLLNKTSNMEGCCGHRVYNYETHICNQTSLEVCARSVKLDCCGLDPCLTADVQLKMKDTSPPKCTEPNSSICGSDCYNPKELRCCKRKHTKSLRHCAPGLGKCDAAPSVYNPNTHICCDGCLSELKLQNNQIHRLPGKHCCGRKIFKCKKKSCCNGCRHTRRGHTICCGINANNTSDQSKKCHAVMLYNLTRRLRDEVRCCGSSLKKSKNVCCTYEGKEMLKTAKTGNLCCGCQLCNMAFWSCCSGILGPLQSSQNRNFTEAMLQSVISLNKERLCKRIFMGTVERTSLNCTVFSNVLKINGKTGRVRPLAPLNIMNTVYHRRFLKLTPGKFYYFSRNDVFTDFIHDSALQSLHFILSKCSQ